MIKVGIIGGAGYTGGETTRLLLNHPEVELTFVQSRSQAGKFLYETHADLAGDTDLKFVSGIDESVDVIFLCLGHGESKKLLAEKPLKTRLIDLGNDFRLTDEFVYGLPEFQRDKIKGATKVANPGCFATTIQLGLLPLRGKLKDVYSTGITGSTGAGQKLQDTTHFSWRANNISAYKTLTHQHMGEINRTLGTRDAINFVPWRGDFTRGIFVSSILSSDDSLADLYKVYKEYYQAHPFTHVSESMIDMKQVVNTNKALVHLEKEGNKLVVHSTLDNLLKGASGQAVQNMNLMFGFAEDTGLRLKSTVF
ncbi:MAG TPA: N-acetyl-gamma-glutamyl-phosphate reductase [Cyclobacteriaceae bacterium]